MLLGIDPVLSPQLLGTLCAMGHGDEIVIADANFPAEACAERLVRADGIDAPQMLAAILSVLPLDTYVDSPANIMAVVSGDPENPAVVQEFRKIVAKNTQNAVKLGEVERSLFYERAKSAFAIVQTGERRLYGNIALKKGVVLPEL